PPTWIPACGGGRRPMVTGGRRTWKPDDPDRNLPRPQQAFMRLPEMRTTPPMRPLAHSSASILLLFALVAAFSTPLRSQIVPPVPDELEPVIERAIEGSTQEETDAPELIDELERYRRRPIGLYTATADSLARLPGISIQDAFAILDFVDSTAPASMEQLEAIATLDAEQLQVLRAYTSLQHPRFPAAPRRLIVSMRTRFQQDLQPRKGYTDEVRRL